MDPPPGGAPPTVEQFLTSMGVGSPAEFVSQVQAMQRQQGVLVTATDELRNALATSQAMAADAAARAARAEGERGDLVKRSLASRLATTGWSIHAELASHSSSAASAMAGGNRSNTSRNGV